MMLWLAIIVNIKFPIAINSHNFIYFRICLVISDYIQIHTRNAKA